MVDRQIKSSLSDDEHKAAFQAVRDFANRSAYGSFISDQDCANVADAVVAALDKLWGQQKPAAAEPVGPSPLEPKENDAADAADAADEAEREGLLKEPPAYEPPTL